MEDAELTRFIAEAFAAVEHPGDRFLLGSREGREPAEAVAPFVDVADWESLDPDVLDRHSEALSFLSEGGFRFFLPAFLIADVRGRLERADPMFHLTHGFSDGSASIPIGGEVFEKAFGRSALLNPRRYGAMTHFDYARYRLTVFAREEALAIVDYLEFRRWADADGIESDAITAALDAFWRARAETAPTQADLARHMHEEEAFLHAAEATSDLTD